MQHEVLEEQIEQMAVEVGGGFSRKQVMRCFTLAKKAFSGPGNVMGLLILVTDDLEDGHGQLFWIKLPWSGVSGRERFWLHAVEDSETLGACHDLEWAHGHQGSEARKPSDWRDKAPSFWHHPAVVGIADTHRVINALTQRGFTAEQAEALVGAIQEIDLSSVATKGDLRELENRMLKWMIPLMLGQAAVFALIVKWLVG